MILCTGIKAIDLGVAEPRKGIGASVESFFGVLLKTEKNKKKITTTESLILAQDER